MQNPNPAKHLSSCFTSETSNVSVEVTEAAAEGKTDEPAAEVKTDEPAAHPSSPPEEPADQTDPKDVNPTGARPKITEHAGRTPPPVHTSYDYPILPITKNREKLISLIENNSVLIVRGATGSGKTTQLPQFILDHYSETRATCNIVVTQPRKIGATSVARWVAKQRKCALGSLVGYQVALEKLANEHTRLIYMTTGILLQKLVSAKSLTEYSHIFLDEVHERCEEMDFLLLILRKLLHTNSRYVKIILMSATINCKEFAEYFGSPVCGKMFPAYVFKVGGAPHAIDDFYLDDLRAMVCVRQVVSAHSEDPYISVEMYNVAIGLIQSFDELEEKEYSKADKEGGVLLPNRGSVLVFLPGLHEIEYMQDALAKLFHKRLQVYPLHSSVALEEQNGVFQVPVPGYRKVILSTNIAESSVTVPNVKYVIDFCLVRRLVCDKETNYQSLCLTWAAKTNCNQRRGRAGRVSKGFCYRLVTKQFWKADIPEYMIPEMLLAPLSSIMLKVKLLDMGDPRALLATALSPPHTSDIVRTVLQLKEMGALSAQTDGKGHDEDGELTFLGRVLAHLPVDLYLGKMIVLGHAFGCLNECLIIAACHSLKSFFVIPSMLQLAGHRSKLAFSRGTQSDSLIFINAFKDWQSLRKSGQLRDPKDELAWGKRNFIQIKRIKEVAELYEDLKKRVSQFNIHVEENAQVYDYTTTHRQKFILQVVIAGAHYPNYYSQRNLDEEMAFRELFGHNPRTTVMLRGLPPYSFLYYKQLQALFRRCGQVKTISFDSSRAYVEFYSTSQESGMLPEASLALLLAQSRVPVELSVYPPEEVERCVESRLVPELKYTRVNADFASQSICPVELLSWSLNPEELPPSRLFVVNITKVEDVGHFWGFQTDENSVGKLRHLTTQINGLNLLPVTASLYPNLQCLAPYSESSETLYYRAKIMKMSGNKVEVFFLDFGNTESVPCSSLRELPPDLLSLPFQALEFQVASICPSAQSLILGNPWSSSARYRFISLVKGHELTVSLYSILHGVMRVELLVNSTDDETATDSVADILVKEGHAAKAGECFDSEQSHEDLVSLYRDIEAGTYQPTSISSVYHDSKKEEKQLIDSLVTHFCKGPQACSRRKVRVSGPHSPYKSSFSSMSHKAHLRTVYVEKLSINSLAINENPQHQHMRMLVAGSVSVASSGSHIVLRNTTLMPDIPGLPALLTMLFTPVMELRTNEERTCYTGALCGMGWNSLTQEGILPNHDIELAFDVRVDVEDIFEINALRMAINKLVCEGPHGTLHLGPDRISRLQENCQDILMSLFTKSPPRENVTPQLPENPERWNQVEPSLKMIVPPADTKTKATLFQLHPLTVLNL
ncbi:ATP-dependent RNA helicase TDRD9 [Genypterus blacodes]|uniref:ATP-dependent RNA helicase TDRD9 n=1 Tax=Genypterus blacodes TaxID=154954 RepID=UPI003F77051C